MDIEEFCSVILNLPVAPIDLQWLTRAIFNRQDNVIKYTYCLHVLKCEKEGRTLTAPQYYAGIRNLEELIHRLLRYRDDYWKEMSDVMYFLRNVDLEWLQPTAYHQATQDWAKATDSEYATPQD